MSIKHPQFTLPRKERPNARKKQVAGDKDESAPRGYNNARPKPVTRSRGRN